MQDKSRASSEMFHLRDILTLIHSLFDDSEKIAARIEGAGHIESRKVLAPQITMNTRLSGLLWCLKDDAAKHARE